MTRIGHRLMKGAVVCLATALFLTAARGPVWALCDDTYLEYRKQSQAFDRAEKDLAEVWGRLMKTLPKDRKTDLVADQRAWVNLGRDREAEKIGRENGLSPAEAYAEATRARVGYLKILLTADVSGVYDSGMGTLKVKTLAGGRIEFEIETDWPPQKCSGHIEKGIAPLTGDTAVFSDDECPRLTLTFSPGKVDVEEDGHCGYHGLNCNFEGTYERLD